MLNARLAVRGPLTVFALAAAFAVSAAAPGAQSQPAWSKLTPALTLLVQRGGYGDYPIAEYVSGYEAGTAYYLVRHSGGQDAALESALTSAGAKIRFRFPEIGVYAVSSPVASIATVSNLARVTRLDLDEPQDVLGVQMQTLTGVADQAKRGTRDIGADTLWEQGITGKGVLVGIADSGIDGTHNDLDDLDWRTWTSPVNAPKIDSFVDCTAVVPFLDAALGLTCPAAQAYDDNGHGSHVSGIATGTAEGGLLTGNGKLPGVAPEAKLAGAKVCLAAGSCLNSSVMAGFRYLATDKSAGGAGVDVLNASLGGGRFYSAPISGAAQETNNDDQSRLVNDLARRYNVVFTLSAGNSGPTLQSVGNPSVSSQAISVAAGIADWDLNHPTAETEHGVYGNIRPEAAAAGASAIADFSSRGPSGDRLIKPELVAPGSFYVAAESATGAQIRSLDAAAQNRYSTDPTYAVLSGTSMSAPAAAGAAALVIDGYRRYTNGTSPDYYRVKAALANTATTRAWEGTITGLTGSVRVKITGEDPNKLSPIKNADWVGVTGEGSGRIHAPAALLALTQGVLAYTTRDTPGFRDLQPNWSMDAVSPGQTAVQTFLLWGAPGLVNGSKAAFSVESGNEARGISAAPASWFAVTSKGVKVTRGTETPVAFRVTVPADAKPGMYSATILGKVKIGTATQNLRIPVQFFVDIRDPDPADDVQTAVEEAIWASDKTDYTAVGFQGLDIFTDWVMYPVRVPAGTDRVDFSVYDTAGADHMDVFVFDNLGSEIDSTVTPYLEHAVPGGVLYEPTSSASPNTVSILDGDDRTDVLLPATVWVVVSNSGPSAPNTFRTFHLDVDLVGAGSSTGGTPAERIHSGTHAWWGGSMGDASSTLTRELDVPAGATALKFWSWYQLEDGFDWAFALVSTDAGATWTSLATTAANGSGTSPVDPIGTTGNLGSNKPYPNGLTGTSGQPPHSGINVLHPIYVEQTADLSAYAGRRVLLRFQYTSDPLTNFENFYVDDVRIVDGAGTALFSDDMETNAGWISSGTPGFAWVTADAG